MKPIIVSMEDFSDGKFVDYEEYHREVERIKSSFDGWVIQYKDRHVFLDTKEEFTSYLKSNIANIVGYGKI
jgi:hypothetical protein